MPGQKNGISPILRDCRRLPSRVGRLSSARSLRLGMVFCRRLRLPALLGGAVYALLPPLHRNHAFSQEGRDDRQKKAKGQILQKRRPVRRGPCGAPGRRKKNGLRSRKRRGVHTAARPYSFFREVFPGLRPKTGAALCLPLSTGTEQPSRPAAANCLYRPLYRLPVCPDRTFRRPAEKKAQRPGVGSPAGKNPDAKGRTAKRRRGGFAKRRLPEGS